MHNFETLLPNDHLFQYWFYLVELLCSRKIKYEKVNGNRRPTMDTTSSLGLLAKGANKKITNI